MMTTLNQGESLAYADADNNVQGEITADWGKGWKGTRCSLGSLVEEIKRRADSKFDFVADTASMEVRAARDDDGNITSKQFLLFPTDRQTQEFLPSSGMPINWEALMQLGERMSPKTPRKFLTALGDLRPHLAESLLTGLLAAKGGRNIVRCLDGNVRAFLSNRYRAMDDEDVIFGSLQIMQDIPGGEVLECHISDRNSRIKFTSRAIWDVIDQARAQPGWNYAGGIGNKEHLRRVSANAGDELPGGSGTLHPLVTISNSETGYGGLRMRVGICTGACFNLATVEETLGYVHLGSALELGIMSEQTLRLEAKTIVSKLHDALTAAFNEETFKALVAKLRTGQSHIIHAPTAAVENVQKLFDFSDEQKDKILEHFLSDYDRTRYGLGQAVARASQDFSSPDLAEDMEAAAGRIMTEAACVPASVNVVGN